MISPLLSMYEKWIFHGDRTKEGVMTLLQDLGWEDVAFINQTQAITKLDACSDSFMVFLTSYFENPNFVISEKTGDIDIHGETFSCILRIERDEFRNKIFIVGRTSLSLEKQDETRIITRLAVEALQSYEKLQALELTLPLINQSSPFTAPSHWPKIRVSSKFIQDAVPSVWYSIAHEMMGPMIVASDPNELTQIEFLDKVVNVYSIMRSDLIVELGQVFSVLPVSNPFGGESTNVIFTMPNPNARGGVELHGISVTIGRDFVNLSKIVYNELKTLIYNLVEFIKTTIGTKNWELGLDTDPLDIKDKIRSHFYEELENTRTQLAKLLASLMEEKDLLNW